MKRAFVLLMLFMYGCVSTSKVQELKAPLETETSSTIPFYKKGSPVYSAQQTFSSAQEREEREKEEKKRENIKNVEAIAKGLIFGTMMRQMHIPDPWLPPEQATTMPDALTYLPKDKFGYPDWVAATNQGVIRPRESIPSKKPLDEEPFTEPILFQINDRLMANVLFPHTTHTYWLSCKSCHPKPFIAKKGANKFGMEDIWAGKYCGKCHGKVAFAPKGFENCQRCHRVKKKTLLPKNE